jgi:outer membrane protein assembly factor BamB
MKIKLKIAILFLLASCSGEKYDTSNSISILPEKIDSFVENPQLKKTTILIDSPYYSGDFKKNELVKLKGLSSNFEIQDDFIFYVKNNTTFVKMDKKGKKQSVFYEKLLQKKRNIKFNLFTLHENHALIVSNSGDVIFIDTSSMTVQWNFEIQDVITVKPIIFNNKAIVSTSSGSVFVFDLKDGNLISSSNRADDPIGVNFNLISNLNSKYFEPGNFFLTYYKTDLLFFDLKNFNKIYSFPISDQLIDFKKITSTPMFYKNYIISPTSSKILSLSLVNGIKAWEINGDFASNVAISGGFVFAFEKNTQSIVAISVDNGDIKWKFSDLQLFKNSSKVWIASVLPNMIIAIDNRGHYIKLNINYGSLIESKSKNGFYSPLFNYQIIEDKIYYTDTFSRLILLN